MHIAYAGLPDTSHTDAYLRFLEGMGKTTFIDVNDLAVADLSCVDLLVIDAVWNHAIPEGLTLEQFSLPTVLVGAYGVMVGDQLHLKLGSNYGCMCLQEDAIVWDEGHPVFEGIIDTITAKEPPANFRSFSSILNVPSKVPTLRVLRDAIGVPGYVTAGFGFLDSPECEIIAGGFNEKTQAHFAIARQGHFMQWGFSGSPDQYTPQGRTLLANCLNYLIDFARDPVRELRTTPPRQILRLLISMEGWRGAGLPSEFRALTMEKFLRTLFAMDIPVQAYGERPERMAWLNEHMPHLRNDGRGWFVDTDAKVLGPATYDLAMLDECLATPDERSVRLWRRYTGRNLTDVECERAWLVRNRAHLYFTDWGGYRWVSLLDEPSPAPPAAEHIAPEAAGIIRAARYDDCVKAMLSLELPPGFHAYAPGSSEGLPLSLTPGPGFELMEGPEWGVTEGHLAGAIWTALVLRGDCDELAVSIQLQLCDTLTCLMPQTLELRCQIQKGT